MIENNWFFDFFSQKGSKRMKTEQLNDKMRPFFRIYACTYKSFLKLISKETTKRVTDKTAIEMDR